MADSTHYSTKRVTAEPAVDPKGSGADGMRLVYQDGYRSWCPLDVFERDYQPVTAMSFGHALDAMKQGWRVARAGWNGKGMWLMTVSHWSRITPIPADAADLPVDRFIMMRTAQGTLVPWLASQTDMLADDWQIVD